MRRPVAVSVCARRGCLAGLTFQSIASLAPRSVAKKEPPQAAYLAFGLLAEKRWCFRLVQAGDIGLIKRLS